MTALAVALVLLAAGAPAPAPAQDAAAAVADASRAARREENGRLLDAVAERVAKSFWDKDRLAAMHWEQRVAEVRQGIVDAPDNGAAAERINALLAELKSSHVGLLTPDEIDYYVLLDVFSRSSDIKQKLVRGRFPAGVRFAGPGFFTARIDGHDFIDAVLEGTPADRAGLKVGDEIVAVDGAPLHPIRSFRGRIGQEVALDIRRTRSGPVETVRVEVARIAPVQAFGLATWWSTRVIERDGRRLGYIHVWASFGDASYKALKDALGKLNIRGGVSYAASPAVRIVGRDGADGGDDKDSAPPRLLDGLIIDMRGRIGGTGGNAGRFLDLLDPRGPRLQWGRRDGGEETWRSLRGHSALLIDAHTRSTAELFAHAYKRERQGPLIGTRTAGAVSGARAFPMPGGNLLYLAVAGLVVDGDVLEGPGVAPDIEVARPIPYSGGADPVLEAAIAHLMQGAGPPAAAGQPAGRGESP